MLLCERNIMKQLSVFILFLSAIYLAGCSSGINLVSAPPGTNTLIDGKAEEWDNLTSIKNENLAFGVRNDENYIYVAMVTGDRSKIMRILTGGLQIWLVPDDADNKLGIQYPAKPDPDQMRKFFEERRSRGETPDSRQPGERPDFMAAQTKIGILNDNEWLIEEYAADGNTYQGKMTMERDKFSYEIRIPVGINLKSPEGLKAKPGEKIKIEVSTGEFTPGGIDGPPSGGGEPPMGGGGMPPMGGGGGRRGGGMGGRGGRPDMDFKPLSYEFNVTLR